MKDAGLRKASNVTTVQDVNHRDGLSTSVPFMQDGNNARRKINESKKNPSQETDQEQA